MESYLEQCEDWVSEGKDYDWIKARLKKEPGLSEEDQKELLKTTDELIVQYQLWQNDRSSHLNYILVGLVLFSIGMAVTLSTYFDGDAYVYFSYGAILSGAYMMWSGYKKYQEPIPLKSFKRIRKKKHRRF